MRATGGIASWSARGDPVPDLVWIVVIGMPVWFAVAFLVALMVGPWLRRRRVAELEVRATAMVAALDGIGEEVEQVWPAGRIGASPD